MLSGQEFDEEVVMVITDQQEVRNDVYPRNIDYSPFPMS